MPLLLCVAACARPPAREESAPPPSPPPSPRLPAPDPVIERTGQLLAHGDVAQARALLQQERWVAKDRARATLLLYGCLMLEGDYAAAIDALRSYLEKTTRPGAGRGAIAEDLLRHDATGGGGKATSAEEACYFGLYALKALREPETARADLDWAKREAPEPERRLAELAAP